MACSVLEQETAFLQLLEGTVSAFSVTGQSIIIPRWFQQHILYRNQTINSKGF